ncbi:MAG: Hpt domain-containing protein [Desulfobulbaceae bacterium]|nr:MAG: Hpt domain-containing protein [Desulfobulbaceae bacterium]
MDGLNWDKEFALEQAADDADLLQELLEIFKDSYGNDLALIKSGVEEGNASAISGAAHSIKGAAASLGIHGIRDLALSIEADARNDSLAVAKENIAQLEHLYEELKQL